MYSTGPADWAIKVKGWDGFCLVNEGNITFLSYLPTPPLGQDMTQGQFLSGVEQVWIQNFPSPRLVSLPRLKYPVCLPIAGGRIIGFIPFQRVLVLREMQSVTSRIWTRIAVFISYGDNDYTTGTSNYINYYYDLSKSESELGLKMQ